jgi:hypothetical protein
MKYNNDYDLIFKYKRKKVIKIFLLEHKEEKIHMKRNDNNNSKK